MKPSLTVTPNPSAPGQTVDLAGVVVPEPPPPVTAPTSLQAALDAGGAIYARGGR